jgi:hypothetical protein
MKPTSTPLSHQEEFPYGWRYVRRGDTLEQVPLTLEDVLHPREGDVIPENTVHALDCRYLAEVFATRPLSPPVGLVTDDLIIDWGVAGIGNHSPDVAVFVGLSHDPGQTGTLELASLGGRCELVVEVVSPSTRTHDVVTKLDHYYRVGIPLYVIIDQEEEGGPRWLRAYRHTPAGYVEIAPDGQGRIALPPLGLLLGMREDRPVCFDTTTGEELRDYAGLNQEHQRHVEEALQQKEEADQAIAELVDSRRAARRRATKARKEAKRASKEADSARKEAERERRARESADQRIRELEEALRRLQAGGSGDATNPSA